MQVRIYRGIPGSGKSTAVQRYIDESPDPTKVVSADHFFMKDGVYQFDPLLIGQAHAWCFRHYLELITNTIDHPFQNIVVDNTNISAYEMAPYIQAASAYNIACEIITVYCPLEKALGRNVHGVPPHLVMSMYRRLLIEDLPPFWKQSTQVAQ